MITKPSSQRLSDDQLAKILDTLGVHYLSVGSELEFVPSITPEELFQNLTSSKNSRIRSAIIALFLVKPSMASHALQAVEGMGAESRRYFEIFYSAARLLQLRYQKQFASLCDHSEVLPNLFMKPVNEITANEITANEAAIEEIDSKLLELGNLHRETSGLAANWAGTYHHVALQIIKQLENEQRWRLDLKKLNSCPHVWYIAVYK